MIAPMPPPSATPENQDVIASVSAEVLLAVPARAMRPEWERRRPTRGEGEGRAGKQ